MVRESYFHICHALPSFCLAPSRQNIFINSLFLHWKKWDWGGKLAFPLSCTCFNPQEASECLKGELSLKIDRDKGRGRTTTLSQKKLYCVTWSKDTPNQSACPAMPHCGGCVPQVPWARTSSQPPHTANTFFWAPPSFWKERTQIAY